MKYKLLVMDADNTLLCTDKSISKKNLEAIKKCLDNGVQVALASGRPALDTMYFAEQIGVGNCWNVSDNGNVLFKGKIREVTDTFSDEYFHFLVDSLRSRNIEFGAFFAETTDYIYEKYSDTIETMVKRYLPVTKPRLADAKTIKGPYKISTYLRNEEELEFVKSLAKEGEMSGTVSDPSLYDMMPYGMTKVVGTRKLVERLGFKMDEIIFMGDQGNDKTSIEAAGLGVVVSNGTDEVKEVADVILDRSCDEDAVDYVVEKYIFGSK